MFGGGQNAFAGALGMGSGDAMQQFGNGNVGGGSGADAHTQGSAPDFGQMGFGGGAGMGMGANMSGMNAPQQSFNFDLATNSGGLNPAMLAMLQQAQSSSSNVGNVQQNGMPWANIQGMSLGGFPSGNAQQLGGHQQQQRQSQLNHQQAPQANNGQHGQQNNPFATQAPQTPNQSGQIQGGPNTNFNFGQQPNGPFKFGGAQMSLQGPGQSAQSQQHVQSPVSMLGFPGDNTGGMFPPHFMNGMMSSIGPGSGALQSQAGFPSPGNGMIPSQMHQQASNMPRFGPNNGAPNGLPAHLNNAMSSPSSSTAEGGADGKGKRGGAANSKKKKTGAKGPQSAAGSPPPGGMAPAGGVQALNSERSRSHTRSPSVSGASVSSMHHPQGPPNAARPPGTPIQGQHGQSGLQAPPTPFSQLSVPSQTTESHMGPGVNGPRMLPPTALNCPPGWQPSLGPQQQQQILTQAMHTSKQRSAQGQELPAGAVLQQLGFIFVRANQLPAHVQLSAFNGGGAVLSLTEAQTIGLLPPANQAAHGSTEGAAALLGSGGTGAPPRTPQQQHAMPPPQHSMRPSPSGAPGMNQMSSSPFATPLSPFAIASPAMSAAVPPRARQASQFGQRRPASRDGAADSNARNAQMALSAGSSGHARRSSTATNGDDLGLNDLNGAGPSRGSAPGVPRPSVQPAPPTDLKAGLAPQRPASPPRGPPLPPIHGGALPKTTKGGHEVVEYNTRLTPLPPLPDKPSAEEAKALTDVWKPLTEEEERDLLGVMKRDHEYTKDIHQLGRRQATTLHKRASQLRATAANLHWWERMDGDVIKHKDFESFHMIFPHEKRKARARRGRQIGGPLASGLTSAEDRRHSQLAAAKLEDLVPIRLEIDHEAWRLRDTFTWNASDAHVGLDHFAHTLSTSGDDKWWKSWRREVDQRASGRAVKRRRLSATGHELDSASQTRPHPDLRIEIKLDITVGAMNLVDRFEWDIEDDGTSPEAFAETFAADLGLAGEFKTAVAHSIREQVDVHRRSLALVGHVFDGSEVQDEDLRAAFLPPLTLSARGEQDAEGFTPRLNQLSEADIDALEREREREARRKRRQTRGRRGVNLPDREPQKTQRTPAVGGLQAVQVAAFEAAHGGAFGTSSEFGASGRGERGGGMSTRRAAAQANASITGVHDGHDFSTPAPETAPDTTAKSVRLESHAIHFAYPGGLGGPPDSDGPRFAPSTGNETRARKAKSPVVINAPTQPPEPPPLSAKAAAAAALAAKDLAAQHPNIHDGQWFCSNCGVAGSVDTGRRKGPLGEKSLCGVCGKYYHRHRRVPTMHYTRDEAYHRGNQHNRRNVRHLQLDAGDEGPSTQPTSSAGTPAGTTLEGVAEREGENDHMQSNGIAKLSTNAGDLSQDDDDDDEEGADVRRAANGRHTAQHSTRGNSPDLPFLVQVGSPDEDSDSSSDEKPGGQDGVSKRDGSAVPRPPAGVIRNVSPLRQEALGGSTASPKSAALATSPLPPALKPPEWLTDAAVALRAQYAQDRFEIVPKPRKADEPAPVIQEWRVRCNDCPGKLYTAGPDQTLQNFSIHLRNRQHRNNVASRRSG
ncbi:SWI-SNF chromatin remodeling complex, Snf5 subunit [Ceraceosorus bombacis]|uniref:SWI-SNF chromatin remodeling complex, Snf5 subunit n=1 Tax=Ceraceosorus bombacis TaxID=401625 RepID=A0A0N7L8S9_9BASI|nr:SWI-SNF chromatin remodeling complex, Snf5 subunit [Ceraceosorus bombacis]